MTLKPYSQPLKSILLAGSIALSLVSIQPVAADGGGTYSGYDANRDGYLDRDEFETFAQARRKRSASPDIWAFEGVDSDVDGRISEQEMVNALMREVEQKQRRNR